MPRWMAAAFLLASACGQAPTTTLLQPPAQAIRDGGPNAPAPRDAGPPVVIPRDGATPTVSIDQWLAAHPRITVDDVYDLPDGDRLFALRFQQPEDHFLDRDRWFDQHLLLRYRGADRPVVLHTTGYHLFGGAETWIERSAEPASLFGANELIVEHRFFGDSIVQPRPDWTKMNIAQSAADSHDLIVELKDHFTGNWVATGVSKGGMTAYFHHHHHPEDLDGVIAYVAPISFGEDRRYQSWMDRIGPSDCRAQVLDVSAALITRRAQVATAMRTLDPGFNAVPPDVLEAAVAYDALTFEWGFWQYFGSPEACEALADPQGPAEDLANWVQLTPDDLTNPQPSPTLPYRYQVANELGSPAYGRPELWDLARDIDFSVLPRATGGPSWDPPRFDPEPMVRVDRWLRTQAPAIVGIYGAWDPWTGGMPTVSEDVGSTIHVVPQIGHRAQLELVTGPDRTRLLDRMVDMMGAPPVRNLTGSNATLEMHQALVDAVLELERH
ncbi:MAG: S28 family serine protease [Deltaproteobacteria bacterium]